MSTAPLSAGRTTPTLAASHLLWLMLLGEGLALILTLALGLQNPFRFFAMLSLAIQFTLLLTLIGTLVAHRRHPRLTPPALANIALLLFVASALLLTLGTGFIFAPTVALSSTDWHWLLLRLCGISIVAAVLGLALFHVHWRTRSLSLRLKQAELDLLRARVNPHFLFNTLNTATALVHEQPQLAEQVLLDLSDLFRAALADSGEHGLAEEIALTRRYLEIEQLRLDSRLDVGWALPEPLPPTRVPALAVQTLVENAVRHGIERLPGGGRLRIEAGKRDGVLSLVVRNPLPGDEADDSRGHRLGIEATRARMAALGEGAGLHTRSHDGEFVAELRLPLR
ncbi:sensor histidine kinase [Luteimonas sp. e5]